LVVKKVRGSPNSHRTEYNFVFGNRAEHLEEQTHGGADDCYAEMGLEAVSSFVHLFWLEGVAGTVADAEDMERLQRSGYPSDATDEE
jgi:hypothetical protein